MFEAIVSVENLEEDVVKVGLSINFKLFYNGGELVCDASSIEQCKNITMHQPGHVPLPLPPK